MSFATLLPGKKRYIFAVCFLAFLLYACSDDSDDYAQAQPVYTQPAPQPPVMAQQQPVVVQQQPPVVVQSGGSDSGFFHGLLMGHIMSSNSRPVYHNTTRTVVVRKTYVSRPVYRSRSSSYYGSRPSFRSRGRR